MPRRKRPPESACRLMAVIAAQAGVRACICMMPVPPLIFVVRANSHDTVVTASPPQASLVQAESKPRRSASSTKSRSRRGVGPVVRSRMLSFIDPLPYALSGVIVQNRLIACVAGAAVAAPVLLDQHVGIRQHSAPLPRVEILH